MSTDRLAVIGVNNPHRAHTGAPDVVRFARPQDRLILGALALAILIWPAAELAANWPRPDLTGRDFTLNIDAAAGWLRGEPFYPPAQLAGPFTDDYNRILYPPTALLLFAIGAIVIVVIVYMAVKGDLARML